MKAPTKRTARAPTTQAQPGHIGAEHPPVEDGSGEGSRRSREQGGCQAHGGERRKRLAAGRGDQGEGEPDRPDAEDPTGDQELGKLTGAAPEHQQADPDHQARYHERDESDGSPGTHPHTSWSVQSVVRRPDFTTVSAPSGPDAGISPPGILTILLRLPPRPITEDSRVRGPIRRAPTTSFAASSEAT